MAEITQNCIPFVMTWKWKSPPKFCRLLGGSIFGPFLPAVWLERKGYFFQTNVKISEKGVFADLGFVSGKMPDRCPILLHSKALKNKMGGVMRGVAELASFADTGRGVGDCAE